MKQTIVVFISLLIDLLAFTLILPLFPKIFEYYNSNPNVRAIFILILLTNIILLFHQIIKGLHV